MIAYFIWCVGICISIWIGVAMNSGWVCLIGSVAISILCIWMGLSYKGCYLQGCLSNWYENKFNASTRSAGRCIYQEAGKQGIAKETIDDLDPFCFQAIADLKYDEDFPLELAIRYVQDIRGRTDFTDIPTPDKLKDLCHDYSRRRVWREEMRL